MGEPTKPALRAGCPHQLAAFHNSNPDRPRNTRLARVSWPCILKPGHVDPHRTALGRRWT